MKGKKNWRLSKTLKRPVEIRPIEQDDVKYAWASYKKGVLGSMGPPFDKDGMDAPTFKTEFETFVLTHAHAAWTVMAQTSNGFLPVGLVLGSWAPNGAFMIILGISWFPWATRRNIVEGTVAFFNRLRKEMGWMGFASLEHKRIYDVCCMHGIMNRVGTSLQSGQPIAVYEGRH